MDRIRLISEYCRGKNVLDLGCYDETALIKLDTSEWLHKEICSTAANVDGVDSADGLPAEGRKFFENEYMYKGDVYGLHKLPVAEKEYDVAVAGELIEHLGDTLSFLKYMKENFKGEYLLLSTPNAANLSNHILGLFGRESCHKDHYQIYSYKTLNTLFMRAGFKDWEIIPYHVKFTEMILRSGFAAKLFLKTAQKIINIYEYLFPLLSGGLIAKIRIR